MSDVNSNINVNIDTSEALASIKNLQRQISLFHQEMARSGSAANQAAARSLQSTLMNNINATGQFRSQIRTIQSETEHFTEQLERNKMSVGQYFRYAGAATKSFGRLWKSEFSTIEKVAIERVKTLQTQYIKLGRDANGALKAIQVRPLALDMNNFATKAAVAAQKQALLNQLLRQGSTAMLNWGKNTQWAGRQLMVGFTIPLAMAGTAAAKAYIDFEKAAIKFKRVYGDFNTASSETDKMADSIKKLALEYTKYGVAVTDTMNMAADAAAMGKTGVDLLQQIQQANKLAVLGNVEQSQALETTMSLTNAFGIATEDLTKKIDFLNSVENQTVTSIEDLTIAIPKAAPVIKQLGGDVEDLAYFLTAMKEGGIDASEGANALKSGLASIINPSAKASDFLADLGINIKGIADANKGDVAKTVTTLAQELDKLEPLERARAIEQLFGKFQFARMSTLFQNITKDGSQAQQVLKMTQMTAEELAVLSEREMKKIESSPAYKFQKVLADIQAKLVPIGEAFLKAVTPIVEWAGGFLDNFNKMGEGAKQFAIMATIAIGGIGPVALMAFGLIANGVANLIKMFASMKSFFNGTRGGAKDLGDATEYMTQQQLEAQAVATSLDQAHAKLTQQFTVQSDAIRNLTAEYERAIGAQASVGANTPGFSTGGTVSGPGGPTSDNLVTKVSSGEEIMSVAQVEKAGRMANLLDKIPASFSAVMDKPGARRRKSLRGGIESLDDQGLGAEAIEAITKIDALGGTANQASQILRNLADAAKGGPEAVKSWMAALTESSAEVSSASGLIELQKKKTGAGVSKNTTNFTHVGSGIEMGLDEAESRGLLAGSGNEKYAKEELEKWRSGGNQGPAPKFAVKSMFGMSKFDKNVNRAMAAEGADVSDFNKAFDLAGVQKWNESVEAGGGNLKELSVDIDAFDAKIKQIIADSGASKVFDTRAQAQAYGPGAIALEDAVSQARTAASPALQTAIDTAASTARETRVGASGQPVSGKFNQGEIAGDLKEQFKGEMHQVGVDGAAGLVEGAKGPDGLDTNSPSRKMHQVGMDGAQGLINGAKEGFAKPSNIPGAPPPLPTPVEAPKTGFMAKMKGVASDVGAKSLDLVATGIDKGKAKVTQAAQSYVDNWNAGIDREVAASQKASQERMRLSSEILQATDAEYQANAALVQAHQTKMQSGQSVTDAEIQAAIQANEANYQKRSALAKDIENSGKDLDVIRQRLQNATKADGVNDLEAANAQQDSATINQRGANAQGGTSAQQIIDEAEVATPMTYGQFRNDTKKMSRRDRKAAYKNLSKADRKSVRAGSFKAVGGGMQKAAMVGTMAAGAASMLPGPVGKAAQDATPLLGSMSMLAGLITGPVSGAFVALAAIIGGIIFTVMKLDEAFKKSSQEQIEIANKLGSSAEAISTLAEASGSVTGSEYMDKINKQKMTGLFAAPGKTTFGENFVQGDAGKAMIDAAKKQLASGGDSSAVASTLTQQLSTGVMSGAISSDQARSIAANIAAALGDTTIGLKVNAQVMDIVGPDGKSFEENPAMVATRLYEKNASEREGLMKGMNPGTVWSGGQNNATNRNITAGGTIAAAAGIGAGIGALVSGPFAPVGAAVGAIAGAITGVVISLGTMEEQAKKAGRAAGAVVANVTQGLEQQKQITASLDAYYDKKLKEAEAEGDIAEYKRLQLEYDQKKKELGEANAAAAADMIAAYENADQGGKEAMDTGMTNALDTKFKDDANAQLVLPALKEQIQGLKDAGKSGEAFALQAQLLNGMDPTQLTKFLAGNEGGTEEQNKQNTESTDKLISKGGTRLQEAMNVSQGITDQTVRTTFLTQVSGMDDAEAKKAQDLALKIQSFGGVMPQSVDTMLSYVMDPANAEAKAEIDRIQGALDSDNVTTIEKVYEIMPELEVKDPEKAKQDGLAFNEEYFKSLKNEQQQETYVSTVSTILEVMSGVVTTEQLSNNEDFMRWVQEKGLNFPGDHSVVWWKNTYAEAMGQKVTSQSVDNTGTAPKPKTSGGGGGGGPEAHWTDDVVKSMRDFVKPNQKLTTGINASVSALKNFKKAGDAAFDGLSNSLRKAGASEGMLQKILEDDAKNVGRFFKNGKLTAEGLKVQARIYQASLGKYVDSQRSAIRTSNDQATAMRKLTAAGLSYVGASEMVQDTELAQAIARGASTKQIKAMIQAYKDAQVAAYRLNETTAEGRAKNSIEMAEAQTKALQATADRYQTGIDMIASQEQDINKTYEKRMEALDKVLQINQEIAESQQDQLNLAGALSKGDIFAAAKAMADQKAKNAQKAAEDQKEALTAAKDNQIKNLTATIGGKQMTREQLEQKIKDINDQVLKIKRDEIDAQNELIARKEYEAKLDTEKAARNAPAKKKTTTKKVNAAGGGGGGGNGGGNGNGKDDKKEPAKPLTAYQKKLKGFDDNIAKSNKLAAAVEAKLVAERKRLETYRQMGSAGAGPYAATQKKIADLSREKSRYLQAASEYGRQKKAAQQQHAREEANAKRLGVNFLKDGKSPKRMGFMNHPFARGMDVMPSMIGLKEFVMSAPAVKKYGRDTMMKMNAGHLDAQRKQKDMERSHKSFKPVYNINVDVAKTDASPEEIASAVMKRLSSSNNSMIRSVNG
jgi:TP901 family phage tail tape measure protein